MNTNMIVFKCFQKSLRSCALGESNIFDIPCHLAAHGETNFCQMSSGSKKQSRIVAPVTDHAATYRKELEWWTYQLQGSE